SPGVRVRCGRGVAEGGGRGAVGTGAGRGVAQGGGTARTEDAEAAAADGGTDRPVAAGTGGPRRVPRKSLGEGASTPALPDRPRLDLAGGGRFGGGSSRRPGPHRGSAQPAPGARYRQPTVLLRERHARTRLGRGRGGSPERRRPTAAPLAALVPPWLRGLAL